MLDPNLEQYMSKGYVKIGEISYQIALNLRKSKNHIPAQRNLWEQGIKMSILLKVLFRHVTFDEVTGFPTLWRITEEQANKFIRCLIKLGELDKLPVVPTMRVTSKPVVVATGLPGAQGIPGQNGTDADIIVEVGSEEDEITVAENIVLGVKHYVLNYTAYIAQQLSVAIQGGKIFEVGDARDFNIQLISTKGTKDIVTLTCTNPTVDAALQPLVNLGDLNDEGDQPVTILVPVTGQEAFESFAFALNDNRSNIIASDAIYFYYPFLFGASDIIGINQYTALTKYINAKATYEFLLNGTDKYFWICYPSSYGVLSKILDENGFNAISGFTSSLVNVSSSGLDNDWTVEYRCYRTTLKTTISNALYKAVF